MKTFTTLAAMVIASVLMTGCVTHEKEVVHDHDHGGWHDHDDHNWDHDRDHQDWDRDHDRHDWDHDRDHDDHR